MMRRTQQIIFTSSPRYGYVPVQYYKTRRYGLTNFIGDVFMTGATFGFWLIWVFIREFCR